MQRNPHLKALSPSYLFPEINQRKKQFLHENPEAKLISLGIGDTTEPIPLSIAEALVKASLGLGTKEGYSGYGDERGQSRLRQKIAEVLYQNQVSPDEVFISDGTKCDLGRLQLLFGKNISIAVQDPSYPVYIEGSLMQGVSNIVKMGCTPENNFFPDLTKLPKVDLIYFCSPNNPTGAVATRAQLTQLVEYAHKHKTIIIYDAAYANYIQDPHLPKSIFEIAGAKEVALELNSFSKLAGFTGIRLAWSVVPEALKYEDGLSVRSDWHRVTSTIFNGASNIAQLGGTASLECMGMQEIRQLTRFYLENAYLLKKALSQKGIVVFGGEHAPYLWAHFKKNSWEVFEHFLKQYQIVVTPGSGFGAYGEGFIRLSAFGHRENILLAVQRLEKYDAI